MKPHIATMKPHIAKMPGGRWGVWRSRAHQWHPSLMPNIPSTMRWPAAHGPDLSSAFKLALVVADDNRRNQ